MAGVVLQEVRTSQELSQVNGQENVASASYRMQRIILIITLTLAFAMSVTGQNNYYQEKARSYQREAEYYQKKADGYRRQAEYYFKQAAGHEREAAYCLKTGDLLRAATQQHYARNANDRAKTQMRYAKEADDKAAMYLRWAADALRKQ